VCCEFSFQFGLKHYGFETVEFSRAATFDTRKQFNRLIAKNVFRYLTDVCKFQTKIDLKMLKTLNGMLYCRELMKKKTDSFCKNVEQ